MSFSRMLTLSFHSLCLLLVGSAVLARTGLFLLGASSSAIVNLLSPTVLWVLVVFLTARPNSLLGLSNFLSLPLSMVDSLVNSSYCSWQLSFTFLTTLLCSSC